MMAGHRTLRNLAGLLVAAALFGAACGNNPTAPDPSVGTQQAGSGGPEPTRIRFALPPDPVWHLLSGSGIVAEWEAANNIRIETSHPFDQFSAFAGGHADMVVINALDVPQFVEQSDRDPAIVGKYTTDRSILAVKRTSQAENLGDLVEKRIAVESSLGSTLLWGLIAEALHGLEFRVDSPDFDLIVVEQSSVADLVMRGDVDACICLPDFSVPYLAEGTMKALYNGRPAARIYAEDVVGDPAALPMADIILIDQQWHVQNETATAALLELWDAGLGEWRSRKEFVITEYPNLFSVTTDAEIAWIINYANTQDWVVPSAYISQEEAAAHRAVFDEMQRAGLVGSDMSLPILDIIHLEAGDGHDGDGHDGDGHDGDGHDENEPDGG